MITDALLSTLSRLVVWFGSLLPIGEAILPVGEDIALWIGEKLGPVDAFIPMHETFQTLIVIFLIWMPAATLFVFTEWCFRHFPVIGKG